MVLYPVSQERNKVGNGVYKMTRPLLSLLGNVFYIRPHDQVIFLEKTKGGSVFVDQDDTVNTDKNKVFKIGELVTNNRIYYFEKKVKVKDKNKFKFRDKSKDKFGYNIKVIVQGKVQCSGQGKVLEDGQAKKQRQQKDNCQVLKCHVRQDEYKRQ